MSPGKRGRPVNEPGDVPPKKTPKALPVEDKAEPKVERKREAARKIASPERSGGASGRTRQPRTPGVRSRGERTRDVQSRLAEKRAAPERTAPQTKVAIKEKAPKKAKEKAPEPVAPVSGWRQRLYRIPVLGAIFYIIWPAKRSGGIARKTISASFAIIALLGVGMAAYPWAGQSYPGFYRVPVEKLIEWSNFLSDLQTNKLQGQLAKEFAGLKAVAIKEGDPMTRFEIPKLGVDTIVVQGTSPSALRAGAGHYPSTPLPGQKGNVAIAGHRTTYGRPFARVDGLKVGDKIILTTPIGRYTYAVSRPPFITHPFDWTIIAKSKDPLLTLTTCHPKGSARERLVVRAKLIRTQPVVLKKA